MNASNASEWNDAVVVLAANDISAELPQMPLSVIVDAAAECRRHVSPSAGPAALRHCIRRRALGFAPDDLAARLAAR
jgi:hypothetical protein